MKESAKPGKHLTFLLDGQEYAIDLLRIREIVAMLPITRVPKAPPSVVGVINLRGKVIPVIDLRSRFELQVIPYHPRTCLIIVHATMDGQASAMGLAVDSVCEVIEIKQNQLEPAPEYGDSDAAQFLLAMARIGERVAVVLDVDRIVDVRPHATVTAEPAFAPC